MTAYDAIIVGSGPGGASVARELARRRQRVLLLERGSAAPLQGTSISPLRWQRCAPNCRCTS